MRAWEIMRKRKRTPERSLRAINQQKHNERDRRASLSRQAEFVSVMYRDVDRQARELSLEKSLVELEQMKADLATSKREAQNEPLKAIHRMAKGRAKSNDKSQTRITNMARAQLRKRKV